MKYLAYILSSFLIFLLLPSVFFGNLDPWLSYLLNTQPDGALYTLLSFLLGIYLAMYIYSKEQASKCGSVSGFKLGIGLGGVILGSCPACLPIIGAILPLSIGIGLSKYSWVFTLAAIGILSYFIYMGREIAWKIFR